MKTAFLSLGSNLNNPREQILQAVERMKKHPRLHNIVCSKLYQSRPLGPKDQPDFVNNCVRLQTTFSPSLLLDFLQWLELQSGRRRTRHWGERSLDVDLLYYQHNADELCWQHSRLTLPHPQYMQRDFVLYPLREVLDHSWSIDVDGLCKQLKHNYIFRY